ncbi:hypothetical protein K458DRAFT_373421 [Lentithecium fluviatile CBS 122367]|uniref:Zn(2)-C6 fungal-type domain-containing protein n=1 Tax=Lentithecium fluviatile CBS 122367 TaxID=1168545 RepID=A0A6G1IRG8_9PLEO|nr:hypothetical protein K458DRAFT_373421 [Lentithecium fluviatile CBS 122367]
MQVNTRDTAGLRPSKKVAIASRGPPPPPPGDTSEKKKKPRGGRACISCRKRKVRCSGELPQCDNCKASGLVCVYDAARKDRLATATQQCHDLATLLRELSRRVGDADKQKIDDALAGVEDDQQAPESAMPKSLGKRRVVDVEDSPGEERYPASAGSNEELDLVEENFLRDRDARETGYVGVVSEVRWLQSAQREMAHGEGEPYGLPYGPPGSSRAAQAQRTEAFHERRRSGKPAQSQPISNTTFYLDTDSLEIDVEVNPHDLPSPDVADKLLACFLRTVHRSFPILPNNFEEQFAKFFDAVKQGAPLQVPDKWLAVLNLVFAIGARFSHLVNAEWQSDHRDHLIYMTRALRLVNNASMLALAPELGMIQVTGLLSFYYLAIGHVSRAWFMIGVAIRIGLALGLHLRNEDHSTPMDRKQTLIRTWWSLHSVESVLNTITGRPCILPFEDCTVDLPNASEQARLKASARAGPLSESLPGRSTQTSIEEGGSASHSDPGRRMRQPRSYIDAHLSIDLIAQHALAALYAPRTAMRPWDYIQGKITKLATELQDWKRGALPEENGVYTNPFPPPDGSRELTLLRFYYYSVKILITRPCLCRTERRLRGQTKGSAHFNQKTAEACVNAALEMVSMLPVDPDLQDLYENGPWWSVLHHLMQAMAVLLLEIAYQGTHTNTTSESDIAGSIKRLVRWIRAMRITDAVAERAYDVVVRILKGSNPIFHTIANEILAEDEQHSQYTPQLFAPGPNQEFSGQGSFGHPIPGEWYNTYYPEAQQAPPYHEPTTVNPQEILRPIHQDAESQQSVVHQPQSDDFSFLLPGSVANPLVYANPFSTSFDQPNLLGMQNLWSSGGPLGEGPPFAMPDYEEQEQQYDDQGQQYGQHGSQYPH